MAERNTETSAPDLEFDLGGLEVIHVDEPQVKVDEPVKVQEPVKQVVEEPVKQAPVIVNEPVKTAPVKTGGDPMATGVYGLMVERGYFSEDKEFKGTLEELDKKFENLPETVFEAVVSQLSETSRNLLTFSLAKGQDLKDEDLVELFNQIRKIEVNLDTPEGQEDYLKRSLLSDGQTEEDANELLSLWKEKGRVKDRVEFYKQKEESSKQAIAAQKIEEAKLTKQQQIEKAAALKNTIKTELDKTTWDTTRKQKVLDEIFTGKMNAKTKIVSKSPTAVYQLADFMTYFNETTGVFDLDAYKKSAATPAVKSIKENLEKHFSTTPFSQSREVGTKVKEDTENFEFVN
jgi:hypothetical protein